MTSTLQWCLSGTAHEGLNWQNRQQKTSKVFLTFSKSLHFSILLLFVCLTILKAEIILLSRSQSKPFGARTVSICLSIQVLAQQVPVLVIACKCYYRIPGNNGKKGWSHPELLSHLRTIHGSFYICISQSTADLPGLSGPKFGKLYLLPHLCWLSQNRFLPNLSQECFSSVSFKCPGRWAWHLKPGTRAEFGIADFSSLGYSQIQNLPKQTPKHI